MRLLSREPNMLPTDDTLVTCENAPTVINPLPPGRAGKSRAVRLVDEPGTTNADERTAPLRDAEHAARTAPLGCSCLTTPHAGSVNSCAARGENDARVAARSKLVTSFMRAGTLTDENRFVKFAQQVDRRPATPAPTYGGLAKRQNVLPAMAFPPSGTNNCSLNKAGSAQYAVNRTIEAVARSASTMTTSLAQYADSCVCRATHFLVRLAMTWMFSAPQSTT